MPQGFLSTLNEPRTAHLGEEDRQKVSAECQAALGWLTEKEGLQQQLSKVRWRGKERCACGMLL